MRACGGHEGEEGLGATGEGQRGKGASDRCCLIPLGNVILFGIKIIRVIMVSIY